MPAECAGRPILRLGIHPQFIGYPDDCFDGRATQLELVTSVALFQESPVFSSSPECTGRGTTAILHDASATQVPSRQSDSKRLEDSPPAPEPKRLREVVD